jgi:flagellar protein FliS
MAADSVELIHILYEHALVQVQSARHAAAYGDIAGRGKAIAKVLAAVGELEASLDHKAGAPISYNLARLYQYMRRRLSDANVKKDNAALGEVESLLRTLDEGWTAMQHSLSYPAATAYADAEAETREHSWSA